MKKALHIYAVNGKANSGDFFLGPATKWQFENVIEEAIAWTNFDVRKRVDENDINFFNSFDYLVLGGGGLFLPDTNSNQISCWQWPIKKELIEKIKTEIYVMSVGWNLFYGQKVCMPNRENDLCVQERENIFSENVETLIRKSASFTMRHNGDCEELKKFVAKDLHAKIEFDFCPVLKYVQQKHYPSFMGEKIYHTFEIKDDRSNRRYRQKSRSQFYNELLQYIHLLIAEGEKIAVMSHDGSGSFYNFLVANKIPVTLLNNTVANENSIINNYAKVKKLYCTAGHSQMTAHALGLDYYSLICHDKLKYFLQDMEKFTDENYCLINEQNVFERLKNG